MASTLPDDFRRRAVENRKTVAGILGDPEFLSDPLKSPPKLLAAIIGSVEANMFDALADTMEYQRATTGQDSSVARRQRMMEHNDALRRAAAEGNWDEYDQLVKGWTSVGSGGGSSEGGAAT